MCRSESKCIPRRHGQLSGKAQAEEGGCKGQNLGGVGERDSGLLKDREDGFWEAVGSFDLAEAQP